MLHKIASHKALPVIWPVPNLLHLMLNTILY